MRLKWNFGILSEENHSKKQFLPYKFFEVKKFDKNSFDLFFLCLYQKVQNISQNFKLKLQWKNIWTHFTFQ